MKEVDEREDVLLGNEEGGKSNDYDNTVLCSTDQKYFKYVSDDENQVNNIIVGDDEPVKKKVDDKTQITVNQYEDFVGQFASLSDEFAFLGQQNMVIQFSPFLNYKTNKNYVNKTIIYNPSLEANIYQVNVIDKSSEEAKSMINSYNNIKKNIEDGEAKYPKDEYPTHNRILEFEKKHAEFLADPDAADLLMGCPEYNLSFKKTMTNLPDAKFEDRKEIMNICRIWTNGMNFIIIMFSWIRLKKIRISF